MGREPSRTVLVLAVVFAMIFPSVMTWLYIHALTVTAGQFNILQRIAYGTGKAVQFSFPILFVWLTTGRFPFPAGAARGSRTAGVGLGLGFGLLVVAFLFAIYFGYLRNAPVLANLPQTLRLMLEEFGVASRDRYLALGVFIVFLHSLMEEYYWRWFVFGQLRKLITTENAIAVSSLTFMAHHVFVLYRYLPDQFWNGVLPFSLGVAVGGAFWAWLYQRSGTLLGPWLSHLLVDAGIFVIGWDLLCRSAG